MMPVSRQVIVTPVYFDPRDVWPELTRVIKACDAVAVPSRRMSDYFRFEAPPDLPRPADSVTSDAALYLVGANQRGLIMGGEIFVHESYREAMCREWQSLQKRGMPVFAAVQQDVYDAHSRRVQTRSRVNLHSTAGSATEIVDWLVTDLPSRSIATFHSVRDLEPWLRLHLAVGAKHAASAREPQQPPAAVDKMLRVFLCHAARDKPRVRALHRYLQAAGVAPWFDEASLLPGQEWEIEIAKAIKTADVVIVCLSAGSVTKAGYVQREIKFALDVAEEQPERAIFIIPLKLEECDVPERLSRWHWVTAWDPSGIERLMEALTHRARALKRQVPEPPDAA
jgi:hypothetical protein